MTESVPRGQLPDDWQDQLYEAWYGFTHFSAMSPTHLVIPLAWVVTHLDRGLSHEVLEFAKRFDTLLQFAVIDKPLATGDISQAQLYFLGALKSGRISR